MANKWDFVEAELERRRQADQLRYLREMVPGDGVEVGVDGRTLINFSSNDYLGLSRHPLVVQRGCEFLQNYGAGATASRLICGTHPGFVRVEERLAELKGVEKALVFNSGFQANAALLGTLANRHSLVLSDRLNHSSLIEGARSSGGKVQRFHHNDLEHLRQLLQQSRARDYSRVLIATESVFSMDGDCSDIETLVQLAQEFGALLVVDEAHATGVVGPQGMGLTCGKGVDLVVGTFGKACGSFGAYIACGERLWQYVINCCPGFIYTTALPPAVLGAVDAALELIPQMQESREELHRKADFVRCRLNEAGWETGPSTTQIVPVLIGEESEALALAQWLETHGMLAVAIRPPTVPQGQSRLRLTLSALHSWEHVEHLVEVLQKWRSRHA